MMEFALQASLAEGNVELINVISPSAMVFQRTVDAGLELDGGLTTPPLGAVGPTREPRRVTRMEVASGAVPTTQSTEENERTTGRPHGRTRTCRSTELIEGKVDPGVNEC